MALQAYLPPLEGRRQAIRLDFNENTTGFCELLDGIEASLVTAYPEYEELIESLARWLSVGPERLLLTNGSDEGLFVAAFTFIEPGRDRALVSAPTFSLIPHSLRLCQAQLKEVGVRPDLSFDLDGLEQALTEGVKLAMLASPDNPTGGVIPLHRLERWLTRFPETVFVIDEAYHEYFGETALGLEFPNLLVSRTFSKAWGLAGLRLGYLVGHPQIIEYLRRVRSPYSVNSLAVRNLLKVLPHHRRVVAEASQVMARKADVVKAVREAGYSVTEGAANFFVIWAGPDARVIESFMRAHRILVRDRSKLPRMAGSVRVSVGSEGEMKTFLEVLAQFRERTAIIFDLDDTLVDTTESYDRCVLELTGSTLEELQDLRAEGGFNDDWEAAAELLSRRGQTRPLEEVERVGQEIYLALASEAETPLFRESTLRRLAQRHRLFIYTGRPRAEYDPVWGERLAGFFEEVVCKDDVNEPKPSPEGLLSLQARHQLQHAYYVGNSVDDMAAARAAGMLAVGVTTNQSEEVLAEAGAHYVMRGVEELPRLLRMENEP